MIIFLLQILLQINYSINDQLKLPKTSKTAGVLN